MPEVVLANPTSFRTTEAFSWKRTSARKLVGCDVNPDCARLSYKDPGIAVVIGDAYSDAAQEAIFQHGRRGR